MSRDSLDVVLAAQSAAGAFRSIARTGGVEYNDENAFITALVSIELASLPFDVRIEDALSRACDFLLGCRQEGGVFGFYPPGGEPPWIGGGIAPDADDTALCAALLLACGRITSDDAQRLAGALGPFRLDYRPESADPWVERGAQRTWLDTRTWPNPVDVCVNANVAAFLAQLGCRDEGYDAAWRTVRGGVDWFLMNPALLPRITPFYPEAFELRDAVRRALRAGVTELASAWERIEPAAGPPAGDLPICSSHDGAYRWFAPALQAARNLASPHFKWSTQERRTHEPQCFRKSFPETETTHRCAGR